MSNLRLINQFTASSVSTFQVTDIFSSDFDIYKVDVSVEGETTTNWTSLRFLNGTSEISRANYQFAMHELKSYGASSENISTAGNKFNFLWIDDGSTSGVGSTIYFFNPKILNHTMALGESAGFYSTSGSNATKWIGALKENTQVDGFAFTRATGSYENITVTIYGLRVD